MTDINALRVMLEKAKQSNNLWDKLEYTDVAVNALPGLLDELERAYEWAGCRQCWHDKTEKCAVCVVDGETTLFAPRWNALDAYKEVSK